jgi:ceramide glucosyltransferase
MGFGRGLRRAAALAVEVAAIASLGYTAAAIACAAVYSRRERETAPQQPPVTLIVPLRGAEPLLAENLRAFADQRYPELQLVLGVATAADPALPIARAVQAAFPDRRIDIDIGEDTSARNPKLANVLSMMRLVRNTTLILADSDTRVDSDYVRAVTAPLQQPEIGAVTCLFAGVPDGTFASQLGERTVHSVGARRPAVRIAAPLLWSDECVSRCGIAVDRRLRSTRAASGR